MAEQSTNSYLAWLAIVEGIRELRRRKEGRQALTDNPGARPHVFLPGTRKERFAAVVEVG